MSCRKLIEDTSTCDNLGLWRYVVYSSSLSSLPLEKRKYPSNDVIPLLAALKFEMYAAVSKSSILIIPRSSHQLASLSKSSLPIFLALFHSSGRRLSTVGIPEGAEAPAPKRNTNFFSLGLILYISSSIKTIA